MNTDLDLRKLRYFVAVADHLNFGRAAEELLIAQPVLSRQIRALEEEIGAQLFVRDKRGTQLTSVGEQLRLDATPLLNAAAAARRRVAIAARGTTTFTVGFMPGLTVTDAVRRMQREHPALVIEVVRTGWADQTEVVQDGRVDVSYVRLPVDPAGLAMVPMFSDPRVAILPSGHPLASRPSIKLTELAEEHLLQDPRAVPEWEAVGSEMVSAARVDRPANPSVEEKLEMVAAERGIVVLPLTTARFYRRPDIAVVPLSDLSPNQVSLAWDATRSSPLIDDFVAIAQALATMS